MNPPAAAGSAVSNCPRCRSFLRAGHEPDSHNIHGLCDPCLALVESCAPFVAAGSPPQAPADVNLLELTAGLILTHDALHPGEKLYLSEVLAAYGVDVDHVAVQKVANKLERRHGLVLRGDPREPGYSVQDWRWTFFARKTMSSLHDGAASPDCSRDVAAAADSEC